mmetsp:Transcript_7677/g.10593  ORF Transcript_7677/g.10593 Transcript_7677/m.10593 type:complete len:345 (+) Transcript_7677:92-1126(+)
MAQQIHVVHVLSTEGNKDITVSLTSPNSKLILEEKIKTEYAVAQWSDLELCDIRGVLVNWSTTNVSTIDCLRIKKKKTFVQRIKTTVTQNLIPLSVLTVILALAASSIFGLLMKIPGVPESVEGLAVRAPTTGKVIEGQMIVSDTSHPSFHAEPYFNMALIELSNFSIYEQLQVPPHNVPNATHEGIAVTIEMIQHFLHPCSYAGVYIKNGSTEYSIGFSPCAEGQITVFQVMEGKWIPIRREFHSFDISKPHTLQVAKLNGTQTAIYFDKRLIMTLGDLPLHNWGLYVSGPGKYQYIRVQLFYELTESYTWWQRLWDILTLIKEDAFLEEIVQNIKSINSFLF